MIEIAQLLSKATREHQAGRWADAETSYRQILEFEPAHLDAIKRFSALLMQTNRSPEAEDLIRRGLLLHPDSPEFLYSLALILSNSNRVNEAIDLLRRAIAIQPSAEMFCGLGDALQLDRRFDEAIAAYQYSIALKPDLLDAFIRLGSLLIDLKRFSESVAIYRRCLATAQGMTARRVPGVSAKVGEAWHRLGNALRGEHKDGEAVQAYRQSLSIARDNPHVLYGLGNSLLNIDRLDDAIAAFDGAIRLGLNDGDVHWDRSLALIKAGRFAEAWPDFEYRDRKMIPNVPRDAGKPRWNGEPLEGRRIFLQGEQAFGDRIQFIRYASLVAKAGGLVVIDALAEQKRLFQSVAGVHQVFGPDEPVPAVDLCCPVMSLPGIFKSMVATIPASTPYLFADANDEEQWRDRLGERDGQLRIGLVWAGRPLPDPARTIGLNALAPLLEIDGLKFISLQTGAEAVQLKESRFNDRISDYSESLTDFASTAALMNQLDLIITIDTASAHLAGALGKPVWVLLKHHSDYRWMVSRSDSPWYPSMQLYRQSRPGDWESMVNRVSERLRYVKEGSADILLK